MKAIQIEGDERALEWGEAPKPPVGADGVLVRVHATAVNRADLLQRRGLYPPPPGESEILGLEVAGVVAETGAAVRDWTPGARVMCLLGGGGYAEYVAAPSGMLLAVPASLSFEEAAAIPEAFYTAFLNLTIEGALACGETVLVHAGASGVGTAAIQIARQVGARVLVTAGSDAKLARCRELGADAGINYKQEDFAERARALTDKAGVDVVLDCVGGSYLERHLKILKTRGRLVVIGLMGGTSAELDLAALVRKRLRVIGSVLRSRTLAEKLELTARFRREVLPLFESGALRPVIDSVVPLPEAARAHDRVAANANCGKVVLRLPGA